MYYMSVSLSCCQPARSHMVTGILECSISTASIEWSTHSPAYAANCYYDMMSMLLLGLNGSSLNLNVMCGGNYRCTTMYDCVDSAHPTRLVHILTKDCFKTVHPVSTILLELFETFLVRWALRAVVNVSLIYIMCYLMEFVCVGIP